MVSPQQQELELAKAELGKESPVIDKLTQDDSIGAEPEQQEDPILSRIKQLMAR
jgi:ribosome assembly protein YihI (activator of Der GTPase)